MAGMSLFFGLKGCQLCYLDPQDRSTVQALLPVQPLTDAHVFLSTGHIACVYAFPLMGHSPQSSVPG